MEELDGGTEYKLGGGTVLAARWRHRISFDIERRLRNVERPTTLGIHRLEHDLAEEPAQQQRRRVCRSRISRSAETRSTIHSRDGTPNADASVCRSRISRSAETRSTIHSRDGTPNADCRER